MSVISRPPPVYKTIVSRKWSQLDVEKFVKLIHLQNSTDISATDDVDVDVSVTQLNSAILNVVAGA